jgi:hypothetical protein
MPISLERAKNSVREQLSEAAQPLLKAGWKTDTDVFLGRARQVISKIATSWKADFVLVGSSGEGTLMRVLLGSTARSVLRQAPCSVEIVRPSLKREKASRPARMKVLIATDGSVFSLAAIRSVAKRPWPKGSASGGLTQRCHYVQHHNLGTVLMSQCGRLMNHTKRSIRKIDRQQNLLDAQHRAPTGKSNA